MLGDAGKLETVVHFSVSFYYHICHITDNFISAILFFTEPDHFIYSTRGMFQFDHSLGSVEN